MEEEFLKDILLKIKKDKKELKHISDIDLALFIDGKLEKLSKDKVISHLAICKRCREVLASVALNE